MGKEAALTMGITIAGLKKVSPTELRSVASDFANSSSWFTDGNDSFVSQVANPVESGSIWSDGGQADAATVMEINATALGVGQYEMDAAKTTLLSFADALSTAQGKLAVLEYEAEQKQVKINDDGSCEKSDDVGWTTGPLGNPDPGVGPTLAATDMEPKVKGVLVFASIADASCKSLLDRIATNTPEFSTMADKGILARNERALSVALYDRRLALANQKIWESAQPKELPREPGPIEGFFQGAGNFFSSLWNNPGEIGTLLLDIGAIGLGVLGVVAGAGGELGGLALDATGVGAIIGVPAAAVSAAAITTGAATAAAGAGKLGQDLGRMNSEAQSEASGSGGTSSAPPQPKVTKPQVESPKLQNFVDSNYRAVDSPTRTGNGTTADAVRKELAEGGTVKGRVHVQKARTEVRGLRTWLRKNPNASHHDRIVARSMLDDLQSALNGN